MTTKNYLTNLNQKFQHESSTEHTYRGDLEKLIESLVDNIEVTNEPKQNRDCGALDYVITKDEVPLGYIEAKDIDKDLDKVENSEQLERYKDGIENLILTNYLEFRLYRNGEKITTVKLADQQNGEITINEENLATFEDLIKNFCNFHGQTIKSSQKLAEMMAAKARLMKNSFYKALTQEKSNSLQEQMGVFQDILINDLDERQFADMYAQTICYGMFAARLHDDSLEDFSRQEARDLVPESNPFLRKLFDYIAGADLYDGVRWIVEELTTVFRAVNIRDLLEDFGSDTQQNDPMIHFYETFLSEYNPKLRKSRGVYYTPEPIVNFIVRAVDDVLKDEFDLSNGLANTDKTTIEVNAQGSDKRRSDNQKKRTKEVHKVQILDPAAGTGTFLAEVIRQIHEKFQGQEGIWSSYVEQELIPRLNGFELMMAPYAMCHLKLDMMLRETGYEPTEKEQRLKVFLTNSLEEAEKESDNLFMAKWLSNEAREANVVKRDMPIMVVLGNPPYSVSSSNKGKWIRNLMEDYKKDLDLRNTQPLSDDYIKFIRYSEHFVEQNDQGVVSIVTNNSFLDGIIHKKMREHLLNTFDKIYIYNLNGDVTRSRVSKSKVKDENVFDIQAGVTISVFVKDANSESGHANVLYKNLLGEREDKYNELLENNIGSIDFKEIEAAAPNYFFVPKKFEFKKEYEKGFKIDELFDKSSSGITTSNDKELVSTSKFNKPTNIKYYYRPFDVRYIDYDRSKVKGNRYNRFVKYLIKDNEFLDNIMLNISKNVTTEEFESILVSDSLIDRKYCDYSRGPHAFPIYIYPEQNEETLLDGQKNRKPNLNEEVIEKIADKIDLKFTPEKTDEENTFAPVDLLDYIYAVLHSPDYRSKYNEFLKIDFPRVPYPENAEEFWAFVEKGSELRSIHLMESDKVDDLITSYPESGDNKVEKYDYEGDEEKGKVWLNDEQYFDGVPKKAWEFYIGGYQPAQKWLKYRKGEKLSPQDILHWQKMIVALNETDRVMGEVNNIKEF